MLTIQSALLILFCVLHNAIINCKYCILPTKLLLQHNLNRIYERELKLKNSSVHHKNKLQVENCWI